MAIRTHRISKLRAMVSPGKGVSTKMKRALILGAFVLGAGLLAAQPEQVFGKTATPAKKAAPTKKATPKKKSAKASPVIKTKSGLMVQDLRKGTGAVARAGKTVTVHYRGTLTNGKKFDASYDRGQPFVFPLGAGQVIKGWDEGVAGMRVGGKRKLIIPARLGYGAQGTPGGPIPPNATLVFVVELLKVS